MQSINENTNMLPRYANVGMKYDTNQPTQSKISKALHRGLPLALE